MRSGAIEYIGGPCGAVGNSRSVPLKLTPPPFGNHVIVANNGSRLKTVGLQIVVMFSFLSAFVCILEFVAYGNACNFTFFPQVFVLLMLLIIESNFSIYRLVEAHHPPFKRDSTVYRMHSDRHSSRDAIC